MDLDYETNITSKLSEITLIDTSSDVFNDEGEELNGIKRQPTPFPMTIKSDFLSDMMDSEEVSSLGAFSTDDTVHAYSISEDVDLDLDLDVYQPIEESNLDHEIIDPVTWGCYREFDTYSNQFNTRKRALTNPKSLLARRGITDDIFNENYDEYENDLISTESDHEHYAENGSLARRTFTTVNNKFLKGTRRAAIGMFNRIRKKR